METLTEKCRSRIVVAHETNSRGCQNSIPGAVLLESSTTFCSETNKVAVTLLCAHCGSHRLELMDKVEPGTCTECGRTAEVLSVGVPPPECADVMPLHSWEIRSAREAGCDDAYTVDARGADDARHQYMLDMELSVALKEGINDE